MRDVAAILILLAIAAIGHGQENAQLLRRLGRSNGDKDDKNGAAPPWRSGLAQDWDWALWFQLY